MTQKFDLTVAMPMLTRISIVAALECMMIEAAVLGKEIEPYFEGMKNES